VSLTQQAPSEGAHTKACRVCASQINSAAKKCIECDSYQDWRGALGISSNILSLLVALIAVLTAAVPVLTKALTPDKSDVRVSIQVLSDQNLSIFVSNTGNRPASLNNIVYFRALVGASYVSSQLGVAGSGMSGAHLLAPGQTELIDLFHENGAYLPEHASHCSITLEVRDFNGELSYRPLSLDCAKAKVFMRG